MNSTVENKLKMMKVIISVCESQQQAMTSIPALQASFADFKNKVAELEEVINSQIGELGGITLEKRRLKRGLAARARTLNRALLAYAHVLDDVQLAKEVRFSLSDLDKSRDELIVKRCENILAHGTEHAGALADYGITQIMLDELSAIIAAYSLKCTGPREARSQRKLHTLKLENLSEEAVLILKNRVDHLIALLGDEHSDFKQLYLNAREVIYYRGKQKNGLPPGGYGTLEGCVTAEYDDSPVEDALVMIEGSELTAETDEDGDFYFENVPAGSCTLRVMAETYEDGLIADVEVTDQGETGVDLALKAESE